jgi:hypothetical protein
VKQLLIRCQGCERLAVKESHNFIHKCVAFTGTIEEMVPEGVIIIWEIEEL